MLAKLVDITPISRIMVGYLIYGIMGKPQGNSESTDQTIHFLVLPF